MNFCHEEAAEAVDRRAVGTGGAHAAPAQATAGQSGPTLGIQSGVFRRHTVDSANRRGVAILAGRVSFALDLLAAAQTVGGRRCLAECVAHPTGGAG
jgi:hypothetical protein